MLVKRFITYIFGMILLLIVGTLLNSSISITHQQSENINDNCLNFTRLKTAFNQSVNIGIPRLCIITRIYGPQIGYLPVLALSLYHSSLENDRIFIINTDHRTNIPLLIQTIRFINELISRTDYITLLEFDLPAVTEDFGYYMTDRILTNLYKNSIPSASNCQYITFTNGDNFYSRSFGSKIIPHMRGGVDIIAWGFVSHHSWPEFQEVTVSKHRTIPQIFDDGSNKCINVSLKTSRADLGAAAYRLAFLKRHQLYFRNSDQRYSSISDGQFIERAAMLTNSSILLRQTLFVHQ